MLCRFSLFKRLCDCSVAAAAAGFPAHKSPSAIQSGIIRRNDCTLRSLTFHILYVCSSVLFETLFGVPVIEC